MMEALALKLSGREIQFDPEDRRVMCFGHVVDLTAGRVIRKADAKVHAETESQCYAPRLIPVRAHYLYFYFRVYLYIGPSISGYRTYRGTCRYLDI